MGKDTTRVSHLTRRKRLPSEELIQALGYVAHGSHCFTAGSELGDT